MLKAIHANPIKAAVDNMGTGTTILLDLSNLSEIGLEVRIIDPQKPLISIRIPEAADNWYVVLHERAAELCAKVNLDPDILLDMLETKLLEEVIKSAITLRK
jgi:hypothetical protein